MQFISNTNSIKNNIRLRASNLNKQSYKHILHLTRALSSGGYKLYIIADDREATKTLALKMSKIRNKSFIDNIQGNVFLRVYEKYKDATISDLADDDTKHLIMQAHRKTRFLADQINRMMRLSIKNEALYEYFNKNIFTRVLNKLGDFKNIKYTFQVLIQHYNFDPFNANNRSRYKLPLGIFKIAFMSNKYDSLQRLLSIVFTEYQSEQFKKE